MTIYKTPTMWFTLSRSSSMWCGGCFWLVVLVGKGCVNTEAASTGRFNASIREFADNNYTTNTPLNTLQKQTRISHNEKHINREFDPVALKDNQDNTASSSSHGRGYQFFPHDDFFGHGSSGYEGGYDKGPVVEHFYPEQEYHEHHQVDHGSPHSHYQGHHQAIAVKSFLIPLAGIALLSAAAALVTNPVLLQLGVVSGRRRRRRRQTSNLVGAPPETGDLTPDSWTGAPRAWNGATPLPYRTESKARAIQQLMLSTERYAPNTLQRAWLEDVSERPQLDYGAENILEKARGKYDLTPKKRGKRL